METKVNLSNASVEGCSMVNVNYFCPLFCLFIVMVQAAVLNLLHWCQDHTVPSNTKNASFLLSELTCGMTITAG